MSLSKLKLNPEKTEFIVFGSKAQHQKISSHFPVSILGSLLHPVDSVRNLGVWFDADFSFSEHIKRICKACASFRCVTSIELESISLLKWQSLLQMPWLVVVWTIVTLCSEVCSVSISTNCKVFRIPFLVLLQIIESMLMLHPFYRNSTGCLLSIVVFSKPQHLCINFCIVVLLLTSNRSCLLVVVPIVLGSHPDRQYLIVPPFHSSVFKSAKHFGHSFAFDAPKIWNDPQDVRSATSVASFRKKLKTYLFAKAYPP